MTPETIPFDLGVALTDSAIWYRVGLIGLGITVVITMLKQTVRTLPDAAKILNAPWAKTVMVLLPYILGIGGALIPGVFEAGMPTGVCVLFGVIAAHFSERIYKAFSASMPNLVLSSGSTMRAPSSTPIGTADGDPAGPPTIDTPPTGGGDSSNLPS